MIKKTRTKAANTAGRRYGDDAFSDKKATAILMVTIQKKKEQTPTKD
jgi:hypothetical protein